MSSPNTLSSTLQQLTISLPSYTPATPSFLGLPRDIRLQIYEFVFSEMTVFDSWNSTNRFGSYTDPTDPYALLRVCKEIKDEAENIAFTNNDITYIWQDWSGDVEVSVLLPPAFPHHFYESVHLIKINADGRGSRYCPGSFIFLYWAFPNLETVEYSQCSRLDVDTEIHLDLVLALTAIANSDAAHSRYDIRLMSFLDPLFPECNTTDIARFIMAKNLTVIMYCEFQMPGPIPENMAKYTEPETEVQGLGVRYPGGYFIGGDLTCDWKGPRLTNIVRGVEAPTTTPSTPSTSAPLNSLSTLSTSSMPTTPTTSVAIQESTQD